MRYAKANDIALRIYRKLEYGYIVEPLGLHFHTRHNHLITGWMGIGKVLFYTNEKGKLEVACKEILWDVWCGFHFEHSKEIAKELHKACEIEHIRFGI